MKGKVFSVSRGRIKEFCGGILYFLSVFFAACHCTDTAEPKQSSPQPPSVGCQCWRAGMPNVGRGTQDTPGIPPPFPLRRARRTQPLPPPWTPDPRPWGMWEIPREERHRSASSDPWGNHIRISSLPKRRGPCWFTPTCSLGLLIWCISKKMC